MDCSRRTSRVLAVVVATGLAALFCAGCGGGGGDGLPLSTGGALSRALNTVQLISFHDQWAGGTPRLLDIQDVAYVAGFLTADGAFPNVSGRTPSITLTYESYPGVPYLVGTLEAQNLKPNFAYQMKLMGMPGSGSGGLWGGAADMTTNRTLLRAGRWWNYRTDDPSYTTTNDNAALRSRDYLDGWVAGYLYFGCFVTNENGYFQGTIASNRSYHITGKTGQNIGFDEEDGLPPYSPSRLTTYGYDAAAAALQLPPTDVWYEKEPDDPLIVALPNGTYHVVLMITEEAFHGEMNGLTGGGNWKSVMVSDWTTGTSPHSGQPWVDGTGTPITFTVGGTPPSNSPPTAEFTYTATGLAVHFDGTVSSDPDSDPLTYTWDFGDGGTDTSAAPDHTYASSGTYNVTLTVNDGRGGSDAVSHPVPVSEGTADQMLVTLYVEWRDNGRKYQPHAKVTVQDNTTGQAIAGAAVTGSFGGVFTSSPTTANTDASGVVEFYGPPKWSNKASPGPLSFTVTAVTAAGYTWTGAPLTGYAQ